MGLIDRLTTDDPGDRRETVHFQDEVPADTDGFETSKTVTSEATLEEVHVWSVPGSEDALRLRPVVRHDQTSGYEEVAIPDYADGEQFISGEPDADRYHCSIPLERDDEIVILADNLNTSGNPYRFRIRAVVDYAGGASRIVGFGGGN